uniref:Uncharacterized protein n=1 Tax=Trichobilharzia regenti TaxID=157069 RepID=A0AA85J144_TRIRE|nr:unnamed protein product [Trichobilharzia regenti]
MTTTDPELPITPIVYQESYADECGIDLDTIIHVWKTVDWEKHVYNATLDGYKVIVSGTWNLNDIQSDLDWMRYYSQNIRDFGGLEVLLQLNDFGRNTLTISPNSERDWMNFDAECASEFPSTYSHAFSVKILWFCSHLLQV